MLIIMLMAILIITNISYAAGINPDNYKGIYDSSDTERIVGLGGKILGIAQVVAVSTAVVMLIVLAIKYMVSSVDEKAAIKQKLIPYVIGAFILFSGSALIGIVKELAGNF